MFYGAKNGRIKIDNAEIDYIVFGNGTKPLLMIPGLGEGLKTVKGTAIPFAMMYRAVAKEYKVYCFSRRNILPQGFNTKDMAEDLYYCMQQLGIEKAMVLGVSLGGMIVEQLAIHHPDVVEKLILTVTIARQNDTVQQMIGKWMDYAKEGKYKEIMIDTAENSYTESYLKKSRWMYGLLGNVGNPKNFDRFLIQAEAGRTHDVYAELEKITCPTLVIGGRQDKIVGGESSEELAERITGSELYMYEDYGHGLYEEAKDFVPRVLGFFGK